MDPPCFHLGMKCSKGKASPHQRAVRPSDLNNFALRHVTNTPSKFGLSFPSAWEALPL